MLSQQDGQWDVILPPGQVRFDPQAHANGYVQHVDHDGDGTIVAGPVAPAQFDGEVARPSAGRRAGRCDTTPILAGLGVDDERIADLRARQIVAVIRRATPDHDGDRSP